MRKIFDDRWHFQVESKIEKRDVWIGLYWNKSFSGLMHHTMYDIYLCLLPCVPIHFRLTSPYRSGKST